MKKELDIKALIRNRMEDYLKEIGITFDNANRKQLGKAFIEFYTRDILFYLYQYDEDMIEEGLKCDGKNDLDMDFIYQQDNNYTIIQSKYRGKQTLERDAISGFVKIHSRVLDQEFLENNANDTVQDLLSDFNSKSNVTYNLITNAKITDTLEEQFEKEKNDELRKYDKSKINFSIKGISEIKTDYRLAQSIDEPIPEKVQIPIEKLHDRKMDDKQWAFIDLTDIVEDQVNYQTLLTTIKGTVLKSLYQQYSGRLFNYNIRGYLGPNIVNKKMLQTIEDHPSHFYLFNNGISAICTDLEFEKPSSGLGLSIACGNFQIINGAQTATTIGQYKDDSKLKDVRILLRITKTEDIKKEKKGLNKKIILYNNSQTVIKASDFRSNDEIQTFLESSLKKYRYRADPPYRKLIYLPKRMQYKKRKDEIYINMETLAKALYAFDYEPTKIYANSKFLFDVDSIDQGKYWYVFGDEGEECICFDQNRLKKTVAISILWLYLHEKFNQECKSLSKKGKANSIDYLSFLAKWHFLWAYGFIIKKLYTEESMYIFNKIIDGKAFQQSDGFVDHWFDEISIKIQEQLDNEYIDAQSDDYESNGTIAKGFNFKNWLRNPKSFDKLKIKFKRVKKISFPLKIE